MQLHPPTSNPLLCHVRLPSGNMSQNEHKRSTSYYTLKSNESLLVISIVHSLSLSVIGATGIDAKLKDLYVKVVVKGMAQQTNVIKAASEARNETLPM